MSDSSPSARQPEPFDLDSVVGVGLNRLGEMLGAPALEWSIERPRAGAVAEFHGEATGSEPDRVHAILDFWSGCLGLSERIDYHGVRENSGLLHTNDSRLAVRLTVWGVIDELC